MRRALVALVVCGSLLPGGPARAGAAHPPRARLSVSPGPVSYLGGRVSLRWSAAQAQACTLSAKPRLWHGRYTAEWIVEDFEQADMPLVPLADFGSIAFSDLTASLPSWALTADERVGIGHADGNLWAAPTGPDRSGRGFSVRYTG